MASINKVFLLGNLGKDPEVKTSASGKSYINVTLATNEYFNSQSGEKQTVTQWHNLLCFESSKSSFNYLSQFSKKGDSVFVEGKVSYSEYVDKAGVKKTSTEIIVYAMQGLTKFADANNDVINANPGNADVSQFNNEATTSPQEINKAFYTKDAYKENPPISKEQKISNAPDDDVNDLPF